MFMTSLLYLTAIEPMPLSFLPWLRAYRHIHYTVTLVEIAQSFSILTLPVIATHHPHPGFAYTNPW